MQSGSHSAHPDTILTRCRTKTNGAVDGLIPRNMNDASHLEKQVMIVRAASNARSTEVKYDMRLLDYTVLSGLHSFAS